MKKTNQKNIYFFVDEAGDPCFFDKHGRLIVGQDGCSKILMLGFIQADDPHSIRTELAALRSNLRQDKYLADIPSVKKSLRYFHATDDCPEVRQEVFRCIQSMNFKAQFVVARKIEDIFRKKYKCNENMFYDSLISHLFKNVLHRAENNFIYFSQRGSRLRQEPLETAIEHAKKLFETRWLIKIQANTVIQAQNPIGEPCLQIIDYMNWALYRVFSKGEMRYYNFVKDKVSFVWDIYDRNYPKNFYSKFNELDVKKIGLL